MRFRPGQRSSMRNLPIKHPEPRNQLPELRTPGPWGVAGLNQPFTTAHADWPDFPSNNGNPLQPYRGAWFEDINREYE